MFVIYYSLSGCVVSWKLWNPIFRVNRITSDLYAMEVASTILISERATIIPQVSVMVGVSSQYSFQVLSPPLMTDNNLTLPADESTHVPQGDRVIIRN